MPLHRFANPGRFMRLADRLLPWTGGLAVLAIGIGLVLGLFVAPPDYQQGESVRIMYVHVPAAWMALFVYTCIAVASAVSLIWRHPLADLAAKASSPVGAAFTFLALVTGSLWGKHLVGLGRAPHLGPGAVLPLSRPHGPDDGLRGSGARAQGSRRARPGGLRQRAIIKFSVDWWNTLHQPSSVLRLDGPSIHPDMLWPLLAMAVGFKLYYVSLLLIRIKSELIEARLRALGRAAMTSAPAPAPVAQ
jgi:heme exporter protein C